MLNGAAQLCGGVAPQGAGQGAAATAAATAAAACLPLAPPASDRGVDASPCAADVWNAPKSSYPTQQLSASLSSASATA